MNRLRDHGLTPESISKTSQTDLEEILNPVSFYKVCYRFTAKLVKEYASMGFMGPNIALSILLEGLPTF